MLPIVLELTTTFCSLYCYPVLSMDAIGWVNWSRKTTEACLTGERLSNNLPLFLRMGMFSVIYPTTRVILSSVAQTCCSQLRMLQIQYFYYKNTFASTTVSMGPKPHCSCKRM